MNALENLLEFRQFDHRKIFGPGSGVIGEACLEQLWMQFSDAE